MRNRPSCLRPRTDGRKLDAAVVVSDKESWRKEQDPVVSVETTRLLQLSRNVDERTHVGDLADVVTPARLLWHRRPSIRQPIGRDGQSGRTTGQIQMLTGADSTALSYTNGVAINIFSFHFSPNKSCRDERCFVRRVISPARNRSFGKTSRAQRCRKHRGTERCQCGIFSREESAVELVRARSSDETPVLIAFPERTPVTSANACSACTCRLRNSGTKFARDTRDRRYVAVERAKVIARPYRVDGACMSYCAIRTDVRLAHRHRDGPRLFLAPTSLPSVSVSRS